LATRDRPVKCTTMLLPPLAVTESLIQRMASLYQRLGNEIGERPLVLPDGVFFPDPFTGDEQSVARLLRRMQGHAGLQDIPLELRIISPQCSNCQGDCSHGEGACSCKHGSTGAQKGCGTGTCGTCGPTLDESPAEPRIVDLGDAWRIQVPAAELDNGIVLTANLAKALGLIFLLDTRKPGQPLDGSDLDIASETAAVALGFGGLLLAGSYVYSKSCGGPRVAQVTKLSCGEVAILTALFAERRKYKLRGLKKLLGATQVAALDEATDLLRGNPAILDALRSRPLDLSAGGFKVVPGGSFWSRWFTQKPASGNAVIHSDELDIGALEAALLSNGPGPRAQRPNSSKTRDDDLRNLVDEALSEVTRDERG